MRISDKMKMFLEPVRSSIEMWLCHVNNAQPWDDFLSNTNDAKNVEWNNQSLMNLIRNFVRWEKIGNGNEWRHRKTNDSDESEKKFFLS